MRKGLTAKCDDPIGKFAISIESGWIGKVVAVETINGDELLKMKGFNHLCWTIQGGNVNDYIDEDDTQWFCPSDVRFFK